MAFLKYLTKTRLDNRYYALSIFLEKPKTLRHQKRITNRIITKQDIKNILAHIKTAESDGRLSVHRAQQYTAFILFGAYTGQRSNATISKLTVKQFREVVQLEKHVVHVKASRHLSLHHQFVRFRKIELFYNLINMGEFMDYIGKSKISPLYSKGRVIYPQIRLPQRYNDIIGETAHIFETEYGGKRAFFILTRELGEKESKYFKRGNKVLKTNAKVLKPQAEISIESRLSALESSIDVVYTKIDELNNFLLKNNDDNPHELSKKNSSKYLTLSTIGDRRGAKLLVRGRLSIRIEACQKKIQAHYIPTSYALTVASLRTLLGAIVRSPICQIGKKRAAAAKISKS